jgi:membrane protease YdiL (CAAX protease family)
VFALVIGGALGALAAWSGSLAAPVLAHFLVNSINLWRLARRTGV